MDSELKQQGKSKEKWKKVSQESKLSGIQEGDIYAERSRPFKKRNYGIC